MPRTDPPTQNPGAEPSRTKKEEAAKPEKTMEDETSSEDEAQTPTTFFVTQFFVNSRVVRGGPLNLCPPFRSLPSSADVGRGGKDGPRKK